VILSQAIAMYTTLSISVDVSVQTEAVYRRNKIVAAVRPSFSFALIERQDFDSRPEMRFITNL